MVQISFLVLIAWLHCSSNNLLPSDLEMRLLQRIPHSNSTSHPCGTQQWIVRIYLPMPTKTCHSEASIFFCSAKTNVCVLRVHETSRSTTASSLLLAQSSDSGKPPWTRPTTHLVVYIIKRKAAIWYHSIHTAVLRELTMLTKLLWFSGIRLNRWSRNPVIAFHSSQRSDAVV